MADKLNVNLFNSVTPFAYQWILGDDIYEFLEEYPDFLNSQYGIIELNTIDWIYDDYNHQWYSDTIEDAKLDYDHWVDVYCNEFICDHDGYSVNPNPHLRGAIGGRFYLVDEVESLDLDGVYVIYPKEPQVRGKKKVRKDFNPRNLEIDSNK